ncbi:AsmA-like C-terminal region-containing protein [Verrucomicrobiaceae bacterium 227]
MGHTLRFAKTILIIVFGVVFLGTVGGAIYLNKVGFPGQYGNWLQSKLSEKGLHLSFNTLHYDLRRGLIATDVEFYLQEGDGQPMLEAREVIIDLDKTKALRGKLRLRKLEILDGTAQIPVDDNGRLVTANDINGALVLTDNNRAQIDEATGMIEGIHVSFSSDLKLQDRTKKNPKTSDQNQIYKILSVVLDELALWTMEPDTPPELSFSTRGDLNTPERMSTRFSLEAQNIARKNYQLNRLAIAGDFKGQLITLDQVLLEDASGAAAGKADWSILRREGRFDLTSTLQLQAFLKSSYDIVILQDLSFEEAPLIDVVGTYAAPVGQPFSVKARGNARINRFQFLDSPYEGLSSEFSWQDGDLYLRGLEVKHTHGQLEGEILAQKNLVRYDLQSTLPLEAFRPFIEPGGGLDAAVSTLKFYENSTIAVDAIGSLDRHNLKDWAASGKVHLKDFTYRGTSMHHLSCDYNFIPGEVEFSRISGLLNDTDEPARQRFRAEASGEVFADRVLYNTESRITTISNLRGKLWPTPIVRIFAPKTARHLEENYRFHKPPTLVLNGTFAGRRNEPQHTRFSVALETSGATDYPFLGKNLPLNKLTADIVVTGSQITVRNLAFATLGGTASGAVFVNVGANTSYRGAIKWDALSFPQISQVYQFKEEEQGSLTGSIDFRGSKGGIRTFHADGLIGIRQGNLVSLPILGPLSPIIAGVLGDQRVGYQHAKDASATFAIRQGVLQTRDFVAVSNSLTLTGDGWIDLATKRMDMTVRLNARGLLGFLTLPLQPFKGIFQFRGTGNYSNPIWKSSPFTRPARGEKDPLFIKAGKARIVPE